MSLPKAVCVVILRNGAVLAISRRDDPTVYGLPAGFVEPGESPEAAAVRELMEETGLSVRESDLTFVYDGVCADRRVRTYLAPDPGGDPIQCGEGVVVWAGWPTLGSGPFGDYNRAVQQALAQLPEQWVLAWGSGTLRRAAEEGLAWRDLYLKERTAFEFGYGFEPVHRSRLTTGRALAEGDDPATTETCWWARALRWRASRDGRPMRVEVVHARLDDGEIREGIAIVCEPNERPGWLPPDRILVAFTTEKGHTVNPC